MSAHRAFEITVNEFRKNIKMNMAVLRSLLAMQLLVIAGCVFALAPDSHDLLTNFSWSRYKGVATGSFAVYLLWPLIIYFFRRRSQQQFRERTRRGAVLIAEEKLAEQLPSGTLPLSETITLPHESETTHVFIGGATGTGKTQCLSRVITALRARNARAVIYDAKDGEFVAQFYNPETDLIFNPFDARSLHFDVFEVIESEPDFDSLAASVVPQGRGQEQFFCQAARDVLSGLLRYCFIRNARNNAAVWTALTQPIQTMHKMLVKAGSSAAATIENHESPQTQGVISTLMQHARLFRYLIPADNKQTFSLRKWLQDDSKGGFIFLNSITKQRETLKGVFTLFINSLAQEILSLRDNPARRIFILIEEFGTLHALNSVRDLLTLGRSKGCSFWLGIQEKAQLDAIYGKELANSIINQCNNYVIFRMNDSDSAEYFSRLFGEKESELMESTFSSGARDSRDSQSYRKLRFTDKLLLPSQLQSLPNLSCYLKLSGFPLTLSRVTHRNYPDRAKSFIADKQFVLAETGSPQARPTMSDQENLKPPTPKPDSDSNDAAVIDFDF